MKFTNDNACSLVVALCCVAAKGPELVEGGHYRRQKQLGSSSLKLVEVDERRKKLPKPLE